MRPEPEHFGLPSERLLGRALSRALVGSRSLDAEAELAPGTVAARPGGSLRSALSSLTDLWFHRLTDIGRFAVVSLALAMAWGGMTLSIPVYHLFCGLFLLFVVTLLAKVLARPRVELTGALPRQLTAGQTASVVVTVRNLSRRAAYDVGVGFLTSAEPLKPLHANRRVPVLPAAESTTLPVEVSAPRRGQYRLPALQAFTTFPFHLSRTPLTSTPGQSLLVLPSFSPLVDLDVPSGRRYQPGGVALTSNLGESPEYIGNREYRPGDPVRRIDFRSWARLAKPVVREFQEEYYCRLAVVLDTYVAPGRKPGPAGFPELEAGVSLTAALADALAREEYLLDLFAAGPDLYVFRAGRSLAHFDNVLEILACVGECRTSPFERLAPALAEELTNITAVIYVLLDWDRQREQFVRQAVELGSSVKVIVVRETEPTKSPAASEDWAGPIPRVSPAAVLEGRVESL